MIFTDSHAHLTAEAFEPDREAVLERAQAAGMRHVCTIGSLPTDASQAIALAERHGSVTAAVGLHPHEASLWDDASAARIEALAGHPRVVAVGEIGLDYHYDHSPRDRQREAFREQIRVARRMSLPVIVHSREAPEDTLRILREEKAGEIGGVLHCFSGSQEMADLAVDLGFWISFSGILTFRNAQDLRGVAARVPADRLLCETDSPFLSPHPYRGRRNEPVRTLDVVACLATIRGESPEAMGERTTVNFEAAFPRLRSA